MKNTLLFLVGTILYAVSITILAMPNSITEGGFVGVSLLLYFWMGLSPSVVIFISSLLLMIIGLKYLPKMMMLKTALNVLLLSLLVFIMEGWGQPIGDSLIAAIFFGIVMGVGFGLVLQSGATTGGSSTIAFILNKKFDWNIVLVAFILDVIIVFSGVFIIGVLNTLYTVVGLFIGKVTTDYVLGGFDSKKIFQIISPRNEEIAKRVIEDLSSSATYINSSGVYTKQEQKILFIAIKNYRVVQLKRIIQEIDPHAFVVVNNAKDVSGGTFFFDSSTIETASEETV